MLIWLLITEDLLRRRCSQLASLAFYSTQLLHPARHSTRNTWLLGFSYTSALNFMMFFWLSVVGVHNTCV